MDMEAIISTLVWAAILQGLFLSGLYLFSHKHRSFANRLLGLFLLCIVYEAISDFLPYNSILGYPWEYFSLPEVKLFYPLLFFHYILEKIGRASSYRKWLRANYVLAFVVVAITPVNFGAFLFTGHPLADFFGRPLIEQVFMIHQYYAFLLIVAHVLLSTVELSRYRRVVMQEYSDQAMLEINWLWRVILAVVPIIVLWGLNLVSIIFGGHNNSTFELATWGFVIIFIYFVSFQAYRHKNLFEGVEDRTDSEDIEQSAGKKGIRAPEESGISPEEEELIRKIKDHMVAKEPYLDASLSMYQLARQLGLEVRDLSLLINHKLNKHFFDFVNEYRIKKAMELFGDPENQEMTVLEVLYEVGFNSKSSFNTVFKKYTGQTPTQYRKGGVAEAGS